VRRALILAVAVALAGTASAAPPAMPRGSRVEGDRVRSALGFRATVDHFARAFAKNGVLVRRLGPYQVAGVDVVRFLALAPQPPWSAVHVYRVGGVTWVFVVAAPLDGAAPSE